MAGAASFLALVGCASVERVSSRRMNSQSPHSGIFGRPLVGG